MPRNECDIGIIGAGVAGLAAVSQLSAAGHHVICLEATGRIGGRILTVHDPRASVPIELGAEFVHGLPPETWKWIRNGNLAAYEQSPNVLHIDRGKEVPEKRFSGGLDRVLSRFGKSARKKDESFEARLQRSGQPAGAKEWARVFIRGFDAANPGRISVASLAKDAAAAAKIQGDRAFKILNGYDSIPLALLQSIPDHDSVVRTQCVVERVSWRRHSVLLHVRREIDGLEFTVHCRRLIVTASLGVLQTPHGYGTIRFEPEPGRLLRAAASLEFGQAYRVTFRFRNSFWEEREPFQRAGFLISQDKAFFTWWTAQPVAAPILTGWSAGPGAEQFKDMDPSQVVQSALYSLRRVLNRTIPSPEAAYFHDWRRDPFFRGAYSYVPVNGLAARGALARPVEDTLYFAGEATELTGHASTVHGAIASGIRAAQQVLRSFSFAGTRKDTPLHKARERLR